MTRIFILSVIFGFFLGYAVRGHAAEARTSTYTLDAAAAYGPASLSESDAPDVATKGNFREVLAVFTRSSPRWTFGAGIGVFAADLTGTGTAAPSSTGFALRSYTRSVAGEVARLDARYRLTDHFSAGLFTDLLFGGDVAFSSDVFDGGAATTWLGGTELLYGFGTGRDFLGMRVNVGARTFASFGLNGRRLDAIQGVFEASLRVF